MKRVENTKITNPSLSSTYAKKYPQLVGIRGWLIFFLVGLVLSILVNFYSALTGFADKTMYTQVTLTQYPSLLKLITFQNISQLVISFAGIVLLVLIAKRHKIASRFAVIYFTVFLAYAVLVSILGYTLFDGNSLVLNAAFKGGGQVRAIIYSSIWLAYFMSSRRVKATLGGFKLGEYQVTSESINNEVPEENEPAHLVKIGKQLDVLENMAIKLDKGCRDGQVAAETIKKAEAYLTDVAVEITDSKSIADRAYIVYEVQALLLWVKHDEDESRELARTAADVKGDDVLFTQTANMILRS